MTKSNDFIVNSNYVSILYHFGDILRPITACSEIWVRIIQGRYAACRTSCVSEKS